MRLVGLCLIILLTVLGQSHIHSSSATSLLGKENQHLFLDAVKVEQARRSAGHSDTGSCPADDAENGGSCSRLPPSKGASSLSLARYVKPDLQAAHDGNPPRAPPAFA